VIFRRLAAWLAAAIALGGIAGRALATWFRSGARDTLTTAPPGPLPAPWALRGALLGR
jgi:hypothetical protein